MTTQYDLNSKIDQERHLDFIELKNSVLTKIILAMGCALISIFIAGGSWFTLKTKVENMATSQVNYIIEDKELLANKVDLKEHVQVHVNINDKFDNLENKLDATAVRIEKASILTLEKTEATLISILAAIKNR